MDSGWTFVWKRPDPGEQSENSYYSLFWWSREERRQALGWLLGILGLTVPERSIGLSGNVSEGRQGPELSGCWLSPMSLPPFHRGGSRTISTSWSSSPWASTEHMGYSRGEPGLGP